MKKNEIKIRKEVIREPLTSDIIFKAVYGRDTPESKAALIALLNLVLDRRDDPAGSCQNPWQAETIMVKLKGA